MRFTFFGALAGLALAACHPDPPADAGQAASLPSGPPASPALALGPLRGVWQLDYYPDSLLLNRDIYDNSGWSSAGEANLRFAGDSCEFSGWHENYTVQPRPVGPALYSAGDSLQGWLFKLAGPNKLLFRETGEHADSFPVWYPYHRVSQVLTQAALKRQVARQLFAGRYRVLASDRPTDGVITLGTGLQAQGLRGIAHYDVVTAMNWDFLLPNGFSWQNAQGKQVAQYSFRFAGDTLVLHHFEQHPEDEDEPSGIVVTEPAMKLLKLPVAQP